MGQRKVIKTEPAYKEVQVGYEKWLGGQGRAGGLPAQQARRWHLTGLLAYLPPTMAMWVGRVLIGKAGEDGP